MNGHIATQDERRSFVEAVAIREGAVHIGWINEQIMVLRGANTEVIVVEAASNGMHLRVVEA
jgi:hypothetical protein